MKKFILFFIISIFFTGYASATDTLDVLIKDKNPIYSDDYNHNFEEDRQQIKDPLYRFNKVFFQFNDSFYFLAVKPACKVYINIIPYSMRLGIKNVFSNIAFPIKFLNALFQGKIKKSGNEILRFTINSTLGVLGIFDNAENFFGISAIQEEDFGQTLGYYGVKNGLYLVIPFLGPSSLRDFPGRIIDSFLNPIYYIEPNGLSIRVAMLDNLNYASFYFSSYEELIEMSFEPYEALKDAYFQLRLKKIKE
jgi:phospholipid-binding lipoprotein MlaA